MGDPNAQEIGNSIWGVGRLASLLTEHPIPDEDILALLYKLLKKEKELIAQNISMSVNGIRNLAESDLLVLKNTENLYYVIWYLCEKLTALDPIPEEIVSTIDGLEAVATLAESLTEKSLAFINSPAIWNLFIRFKEMSPDKHQITRCLRGLGVLANLQLLMFDTKSAHNFIETVQCLFSTTQNIDFTSEQAGICLIGLSELVTLAKSGSPNKDKTIELIVGFRNLSAIVQKLFDHFQKAEFPHTTSQLIAVYYSVVLLIQSGFPIPFPKELKDIVQRKSLEAADKAKLAEVNLYLLAHHPEKNDLPPALISENKSDTDSKLTNDPFYFKLINNLNEHLKAHNYHNYQLKSDIYLDGIHFDIVLLTPDNQPSIAIQLDNFTNYLSHFRNKVREECLKKLFPTLTIKHMLRFENDIVKTETVGNDIKQLILGEIKSLKLYHPNVGNIHTLFDFSRCEYRFNRDGDDVPLEITALRPVTKI
ncbi:hypothetical protein CBNA_0765 [Coxiella burnetii str. Namibia]|nr:hypothetical protein CBNA_0765 [Coxiella burnetii str. Namibia]